MQPRQYFVAAPRADHPDVDAWAGYPLQFEGQRRFPWQDRMAAELKAALASLSIEGGQRLAGAYMTTDPAKCDVENRLFTNPGASSFPRGITSIRFERGVGEVPDPPVPVAPAAGHVHYYRYRPGGEFQWWEADQPIARWERIPRTLPGDGSCRPIWFALRQAAAAGSIEVHGTPASDQPFGIELTVHAAQHGPRSAPAISETLIDGVIAALHGPPPEPRIVAEALAPRLRGSSAEQLEQLLSLRWPGNVFQASPFNVTPTYVQVSPCDERCLAGEVTITQDAAGRYVEISGELFTLRPKTGIAGSGNHPASRRSDPAHGGPNPTG
jgi:hypothetical protein